MQGRITNKHLPVAERSIPGIAGYCRSNTQPGCTFLELLWKFEGERQGVSAPAIVRTKPMRRAAKPTRALRSRQAK